MALVYSCCFWFSLRLGGILIGTFSIVQSIILLVIISVKYLEPKKIQDHMALWINDINLMYTKHFVESLQADPKKNLDILIVLICIYVVISIVYVYGAFKYNNILMMMYIFVELVRLIVLSILVTTLLLILKQNTMDIGLLIGASVVGCFTLLGMFYLWVCAANLPIVINEKQHDEQEATIARLQQLLKESSKPKLFQSFDDATRLNYNEDNVFIVSKNKQQNRNGTDVKTFNDSKFRVPYKPATMYLDINK